MNDLGLAKQMRTSRLLTLITKHILGEAKLTKAELTTIIYELYPDNFERVHKLKELGVLDGR